jgi:type II secretory pathway component GspD/PulD (secretin)
MQLGLKIRQVPETGTLIVTGYAYRMARIEELLGVVDKPGPPKKFEFRQLEYTQAKALAPKVKTLAEQLGTITVTVAAAAAVPAPSGRPPRGRPPPRPRAPAPVAKPAKPSVYLDADERTNRIMMIGLEDQLKIVNKLIDTLDVEQQDLRSLHSYYIKYVDAMEVRDKLAELGIIGAARATEALVEEPQVVIIEATNSLLVNATPEQHAQIQLIIGYVDAETAETTIPYLIYPLENQDPEELATVLNQLVQETITGKDAKGAKIERTTKRLEEDVVIIADAKTYSLIVYASKKNQQWISSLIRQLDEYRPQVLLDVTLVEIMKDNEFSYDVDLISQMTTGARGMLKFTEDAGTFLSPFPRRHVLEAVTGAGLGEDHKSAGAKGFFGREHIQALFKLMAYRGYGRVLARPKLLVNDNEEGTITTKEQEYVAQTQTNIVPTGTGTTTTQSSVSFQSYDAGITLTIQPHISKGDQLRLQITLNRTDFSGDAKTIVVGADTVPVPRNTVASDVTTVVTVPDGKTIILGGLERVKQNKGGGKLPLLGDIPLIGGLFRDGSVTSTQSRLYVFVKAHVLRPGEETEGLSDIEVVSMKNRSTFEKYEKEMQEYELWPGIKPKPLDPLRILE